MLQTQPKHPILIHPAERSPPSDHLQQCGYRSSSTCSTNLLCPAVICVFTLTPQGQCKQMEHRTMLFRPVTQFYALSTINTQISAENSHLKKNKKHPIRATKVKSLKRSLKKRQLEINYEKEWELSNLCVTEKTGR